MTRPAVAALRAEWERDLRPSFAGSLSESPAFDEHVVAFVEKLFALLEGAALEAPPAQKPDWKDAARALFDALCNASHPTSCRKRGDGSAPCTCGRDAAFKAFETTADRQNEYDLENE